MDKIKTLLTRTTEFQKVVQTHVNFLVPAQGARYLVAHQAAALSLEHANGARVLIDHGLLPPAFALMRPQFECLLRGVWLLHVASENWVAKLSAPLTLESAKQANEGPMLAEMFKQLDSDIAAPQALVAQLKQYRDATWKVMNSYVHGGLHPLSRTLTGYPVELVYDIVRNSNAIVALAAQLISILSGDPKNMEPVRKFHVDFAACLPVIL